MVKKECNVCKKKIDCDHEKYVLIGTYEKPTELSDEGFYHFKCFLKWFDDKVREKAGNTVKGMQDKAKGLFANLQNNPMISGLLASNPKLAGMLNQEVDVSDIDSIAEEFSNKGEVKKSGKPKRKPRKTKQ